MYIAKYNEIDAESHLYICITIYLITIIVYTKNDQTSIMHRSHRPDIIYFDLMKRLISGPNTTPILQ